MGFEAWQTSNEIRSLSVLTMNITCIEEVNAAAVDESDGAENEETVSNGEANGENPENSTSGEDG